MTHFLALLWIDQDKMQETGKTPGCSTPCLRYLELKPGRCLWKWKLDNHLSVAP